MDEDDWRELLRSKWVLDHAPPDEVHRALQRLAPLAMRTLARMADDMTVAAELRDEAREKLDAVLARLREVIADPNQERSDRRAAKRTLAKFLNS
jgi:hypothetical protein